ncbi:MAG TPA: ATPase [Desulfobacteraceae bacterium]|nr:ATPase [Desulfobacteraceae bacterium]
MIMEIKELTEKVEQENVAVRSIMTELEKVIVGQKGLIDRLLIGILCDGHLLIEGLPGLAKTTAVKRLASIIDLSFQRIQFTPDLLPADITGTQIYRPDTAKFEVKKGPIFHNIILADEINRAPAKVQSALLEAMQEKQVTVGNETFMLPLPFLVLATQNPIEQEGTYPLPEAQTDRFMLKIKIDYPAESEEKEIMKRVYSGIDEIPVNKIDASVLLSAKNLAGQIHMEEKVLDYIVRLVNVTRKSAEFGLDLDHLIAYGASPRASIFLGMAARAHAFLTGRGYVTPQDVKSMAYDVLRHRVLLSYEAEADGLSTDDIIFQILERLEVP